jgi:hypothetical protein
VRLHQVRGVCSDSSQNHCVSQLCHKIETEDSMEEDRLPKPAKPPMGRSDRPGRSAEKLQSGGHAT